MQPPLPYRVSFDLHLTEVDAPRVVAADVTGDIEGSARLEVSPSTAAPSSTSPRSSRPTNSVLRAVARLAAPIARYGHEWVLSTGLDQFRARAL